MFDSSSFVRCINSSDFSMRGNFKWLEDKNGMRDTGVSPLCLHTY